MFRNVTLTFLVPQVHSLSVRNFDQWVKTGAMFLRFPGERKQARVTRDQKGANASLLSRVTRAPRLPLACLRSPKKHTKLTSAQAKKQRFVRKQRSSSTSSCKKRNTNEFRLNSYSLSGFCFILFLPTLSYFEVWFIGSRL